jgi:hypothetical protein
MDTYLFCSVEFEQVNMGQIIYFKPTDEIFYKFDNYEIWPCAIVGKSDLGDLIYETCSFDDLDIAIWCVYGHLQAGGLECVSDHDTLEEAEGYERTLPTLKL